MEEKKIEIGNLEVNYKIAGSGPALLILHGWGGSSGSWLKIQESVSSRGFCVISPDFPGFGKSKTPANPWTVGNYVEWLAEFTNLLNLKSFSILAHSFGGRVAIKFINAHPQKVNKLILVGSAGIKPKPGIRTRAIFSLARIGNALFTPKILARFKDGARNVFYVFLRNRDYVKANGTMRETIKKVLAEDLLEDLPYIQTKTLILWGEKDKLVPLKYARVFQGKIKGAELKVMPGIGHSPHLEVPEELSGIILNFLS